MKKRHVRSRKWERYCRLLARRGPAYLAPPGAIREYNRQAMRHNRRHYTYRAVRKS